MKNSEEKKEVKIHKCKWGQFSRSSKNFGEDLEDPRSVDSIPRGIEE